MSLSLWVPAPLQYGELAPGEARRGVTRQAVAQAIKRHLFQDTGVEPGAGATYDRMLQAFRARLGEPLSAGTRSSARDLWSLLVSGDESTVTQSDQIPEPIPELQAVHDDQGIVATEVIESGSVSAYVSERIERDFCCAVQGLCTALALRWAGMLDDTADDEEEDGDEECRDEGAPAAHRVEHYQAVTAIAQLVRLVVQDWMSDYPAEPSVKAEDVRLAAKILLDALLDVCGEWFATVTGEAVNRAGTPRTPKWIVVRSPALTQGIGALLKELPFRFTLQPLKMPVAYRLDESAPSDANERDYFQVDLIGYRRTNKFLRELHKGFQRRENRSPAFKRYIEAINLQQAVPWRINRPLLQCARRLCELASDPDRAEAAGPDLGKWVSENLYQPTKTGQRKTIERPGEFLDNPLAVRALAEVCPDEGTLPTFYLPWKADYRGRIYAETPWLTPQGGDLQRAALEFAQGRMLDDSGVQALRRHGANLVSRSRLLADLGITGRQVATLDERERWVLEHERQIISSAADPLREPFWREVASKPMQFLAFCLAYRQWREDPATLMHLPVQIDGTCNGLQHIAALTGDRELARSVNVLSREDGIPGDIYSELATAAAESVGNLAAESEPVHGLGLELADRWLADLPARRGWINREIAKKVVMTIPYGASESAQVRYVLEAIATSLEREWQMAPLEMLDRLVAWKEEKRGEQGTQPRRIFVAECCRGLFGELRKRAFASNSEAVINALARAEWERMRTLAAYVALAIVRHLRAALSARYPSVDQFSQWLKRTADACVGLPLVWLTPLGLPVCQDKFQLKGTSVSARLGPRDVRIDVQRLTETVAVRGQQDALLPNLIHSLDATHLAMTLLAAAEQRVTDIGSIHDCLLCHPNDAAVLGEVVRETFVGLYRPASRGTQRGEVNQGMPKPLAEWWGWVSLMARFKYVKYLNGVLGALHDPVGMGERLLRGLKPDGEDDKLAHEHSLAVLDAVRRLDPPRQFVAIALLNYLQNHPVKAAKPSQKKPGKPRQAPPPPPVDGILPITAGSDLSDYFFS